MGKFHSASGSDVLSADRLMATANIDAGLDDFGDRSFVEPLDKWLEAVVAEGQLNGLGTMAVQADTIRLLVNRLRFEADLKAHPEILDEEVANPIVILGLPRTGTTKLQRLMSCDPTMQKLAYWRLIQPAPLPGALPGEPDPRIATAVAQASLLAQMYPEVWAAHANDGTEADEEIFLMQMTFECLGTAVQPRCPSYMQWWLQRPRQGPYDYLRRLLQYLQWQDGGGRGRPWVLKTPAHLGNIDVLFNTFPNATLVHCHRHPTDSLGSQLRLCEVGRRMWSDHFDAKEAGDMFLDFTSVETARNLAQRERLEAGQNVVDVDYSQILNSPMQVIDDICRVHGHTLSSEAEKLVGEWEERNPQHANGIPSYSLGDYGLNRERVEEAFAPYIERFVNVEMGLGGACT